MRDAPAPANIKVAVKVTMYVRWRSVDDYQAMRRDPTPFPFLTEALAISKFEPGMYEIVRTFAPAGDLH